MPFLAAVRLYAGVLACLAYFEPMAKDLNSLNWLPFDSRNATELAYDGSSLFARFKNGSVYEYAGVDDRTWVALQRSMGSGQAFVSLVRSRFRGTKVQ